LLFAFVTREYTPQNGLPCTVWFDRPVISLQSDEDSAGINEMCAYLEGLVAKEWNEHGIPTSRIIVGKNFITKVLLTALLHIYHTCFMLIYF